MLMSSCETPRSKWYCSKHRLRLTKCSMFKYTPPWQVLCNSLDHDFKRQASTVIVNPYDTGRHPLREEQAVIHSHPSLRPSLPRPAQNHPASRVPMSSNPKRWVIKPLSPKLEQSDLRSILRPAGQIQSLEKTWNSSQDGDAFSYNLEGITVTDMQPTVIVSSESGKSTPDVVVRAQQVAVYEDGSDSEDWRPYTPSNPSSPTSSTGSRLGFYSFVEDPASPEAEMNEVYMDSPKRQAKLNTLKEKSTFKLQTYTEEKRPGKLFEETNGDDRYRFESASTVNEDDGNPDRIEIIRNQAPKKSLALKEQWSSLENLDLSKTPERLMEGFSLRYKSGNAETPQARVEPGTIDNEQIDFNAVRKQFLMMEQSKQNASLQSPQQLLYSPKLQGQTQSSTASLFSQKEESKEKGLEKNQIPLATQKEEEIKTVTVTEDPEDSVLSGAIEEVDTGLGDRNGGYTSDGSISNDPSISDVGSSLLTFCAEETPIQREIRIAQEREVDLRRSRGILCTDNTEMVKIRTKPIPSLLSPQTKSARAKESNRVSFLIQRELELEKRRQIPNSILSDHNQKNQAQEKSSLESQSKEIPAASLMPSPTNDLEQRPVSVNDTWITEQSVLVEEEGRTDSKEVLSCCPHRHPDESLPVRSTSGNQIHTSAESEENIHSKVKPKENGVESQTSNHRTKKESFWSVKNGNMSWRNRLYSPTIHSPLDPPKNSWHAPTWRAHLEDTNWSPQMQNAPDSIRQEMKEDLRREQELLELRESFLLSTPEPVTPVLTSSEPRYPLTSNEETISSQQTLHRDMDFVPTEKKTDYSYPYSWGLDTSSVSRLSITEKSQQLSSPQTNSRLPSMSILTPQPWASPKPMSPTVSLVTPNKPLSTVADVTSPLSQKGLTETLLKDFEDRRIKLKLEESAYAGIQPIDAINNEVVEATRVTRHKNQRALQWEAGMYANQES